MTEEAIKKEDGLLIESQSNGYNYFTICHQFVRKIKQLNDLQSITKVTPQVL